jgi:hypothetical protein
MVVLTEGMNCLSEDCSRTHSLSVAKSSSYHYRFETATTVDSAAVQAEASVELAPV